MRFLFFSIILIFYSSCASDTGGYTDEKVKELNKKFFKRQKEEALKYKSKCDSLLRVSKQLFQNDSIKNKGKYYKVLKVDSIENVSLSFLTNLETSVKLIDNNHGEWMEKNGAAKEFWTLANRNREALIEILDSSEVSQLGIKQSDMRSNLNGETFNSLFRNANLDVILSFLNNAELESLRLKLKAFEIILDN